MGFIIAIAEHYGHGEFAKALDLADNKGRLPLHWALSHLNKQATRKAEQDTLLSVLHPHESEALPRTSYFTQLINLLISSPTAPTNPSLITRDQTALHKIASSTSDNEPIDPTLSETFFPDVDVNKPESNEWRALHFIARNLRQVDARLVLVLRGADGNAVNEKGNPVAGGCKGVGVDEEGGGLWGFDWPTVPEFLGKWRG